MKILSNENIEFLCDEAGVRFDGIQEPHKSEGEQLVLFTDLLTNSTLALEKKNFTRPKLQAKISNHRARYPKDIEMTAYFIDAMDFIVKKYHVVPKSIITAAANNAAITIQNYLKEKNNDDRKRSS